MAKKIDPNALDEAMIEAAYQEFPDGTEPVDSHPLGRIVLDRGSERYAFLRGVIYARSLIQQK